jgi:hypothetical protein
VNDLAETESDQEPLEVLTDDASWDLELQALVAAASALEPLDMDARKRVLRWAISRYLPAWKLVQI